MSRLTLHGIAWNHSRAFPPLVAASQRFEELHPGTYILWEKRSLDDFGHAGLAELSRSYDLLVIDHPMLGDAHHNNLLLDLQPRLTAAALAELESDALGPCLTSYRYDNHLYALPIDAAAPAASFRPDLLERRGYQTPANWQQLVELARHGLVRMPGFPADLFLNLMGMCVSRGSPVAMNDHLFDHDIAKRSLEEMQELASFMPETIYAMNPIAVYETMASTDDFAYCPFAYTYSNYSRPGFAANSLLFANPVSLQDGTLMRTVLGGTGIAVSTNCRNAKEATEFCTFVARRDCQTHLYGVCGGQPASSSAWHDLLLNQASNDFFKRTLASIEAAYVRPRYEGYIALQGSAGIHVSEYLRRETTAALALERLDSLYRQSQSKLMRERETIR
jgi:multiple sugar transport system substrate-binding protein